MKKPSKFLFDLVKKLTNYQIKQIEKNLNAPTKQNNEMKILLNIIRQIRTFSESKIKQEFYNRTKSKNYNKIKFLLQRTIIDFLVKNISTDEDEINKEIKVIQTLFNIRMPEEAFQKIYKLKKKLYKQEDFINLIKLLALEYTYLPYLEFYVNPNHKIFSEIKECINCLEIQWKYIQLYSKLYYHLYVERRHDNLPEIINEIIYELPEAGDYNKLKIHRNIILKMYYEFMNDFHEAANIEEQIIEIYLKNPELMSKNPMNIVFIIHDVIANYIKLNNWSKVNEVVNTLIRIVDLQNLRGNEELNIILIKLALHITHYSGNLKYSNKIKKIVDSYSSKIKLPHYVIIMFHVSMLYFILEDFPNSLLWIDKYLNHSVVKDNIKTRSKLMLIKLIILYEGKYYELIPYTIRSIYRMLRSKSFMLKHEVYILDLVSKILNNTYSERNVRNLFKDFYRKLSSDAELMYAFVGDFDLKNWIRSKILGVPFVKLKENINKNHFDIVEDSIKKLISFVNL